jgi:peptidoglycan hydrolase-like protein with peptidoglycan-binding domain
VVALQTWLISKGYDIAEISSGATGKGYYGESTAEAVKKYQISIGLPATGFVGPLTRAAINSSCLQQGNKAPVISGGSFPTALKVGEMGTWKVNAYDPEAGTLSYTVIWGDEGATTISEKTASPKSYAVQTATFSHIYNTSGTYTPIFYVFDNSGASAKTSASVSVTEALNQSISAVGFSAKSVVDDVTNPYGLMTVTFTIKISVPSTWEDQYILAESSGFDVGVTGTAVPISKSVTSPVTDSRDSSYRLVVRAGTTRQFILTAVLSNKDKTSGYNTVKLDSISYSPATLPMPGAPVYSITSGFESMKVTAYLAGNAPSTTTVTSVDSAAPVISSVSSSVTSTGATIRWTTNESATSQVDYGLTSSYGSRTTTSGSRTSHSVSLGGLRSNTAYNYRVVSSDSSGNVRTSGNYTFRTALAPTPTVTATPTATATPTPSPTYSPSATPTYSSSPTATASPSPVTLLPRQNATIWDAFMGMFGY